ncbi:hypothetical protein AWM70_00795 [Paenibacillus yonginensis]|uniref:Uncharacterized protein n=1 Tax=Paenibacillus yonginensis TaxID=1462996 RepID=A0A1B1MVU7_9BACL|nr:hypothetical protein AWM70_00795 [Paenibacillus yonginensis]
MGHPERIPRRDNQILNDPVHGHQHRNVGITGQDVVRLRRAEPSDRKKRQQQHGYRIIGQVVHKACSVPRKPDYTSIEKGGSEIEQHLPAGLLHAVNAAEHRDHRHRAGQERCQAKHGDRGVFSAQPIGYSADFRTDSPDKQGIGH